MKRNIFLLAALVLAVGLVGCSPLKKMKKNADKISYSTQPEQLAVVGDGVPLTLNANFPEKYFKKKVLLTLTPLLTYNTGEVAYDSYTVQGEKVRANNNVIPFTGGKLNYTSTTPYTEDIRAAVLNLKAVASKPNGKKKVEFPLVQLGQGVNATVTLAKDANTLMLAPDSYQQITKEAVETDIKYLINQSDVRSSETRKSEVKQFLNDVAEVVGNDRAKVVNTQISAYASPDGGYELNDNLASARQKTARSYFTQQMKNAKTPELASDNFLELISTPEDWEGFKSLMEASNIADKQLILRVLSMYEDPVVREREIKNIAAAYDEIKDQILPQLRRSKMILNYELIGLSEEEIRTQYAADPAKLTANQLLFLAAAEDDLNRKIQIYETATKQYADDFRTWTNLAVAQLEAGNEQAAKAAAATAQRLNSADAAVKNTLAVIAMREGDLARAKELLASADQTANEIKSNLGTINMLQGNYNEAANYLNDVQTESAAIAKLLNRQNDAALQILNNLEPSGSVSYLKAIVAARKNDTVALYQNLKDAIDADVAYKKAALTDVEFAKYLKEAAFQTLVR